MRISCAAAGIGVLMLGCVGVFAGESWRDKAPADWTADELKKVLNDSPWAQQVRMEMGQRGGGGWNGRAGGMGGPGGGGGGGGWGGNRGGGMGGPGGGSGGGGGMGGPGGGGGGWGGRRGGQGGEGGEGGAREVLIRWQSAQPVQEALAKQAGTQAAPAPDGEYVIAVSGLPDWSGRRRRNDEDSSSDTSAQSDEDRRQAFLDRMKESTTLTAKGKSPFGPDKVERAADGTILFYFPKTEQALSLDDHEVDFATQLGPMAIKHKFKLKDMTWQGKLAL